MSKNKIIKMIGKITNILFRVGCRHDFKRLAFFRVANKGVYICSLCNKRKVIQY